MTETITIINKPDGVLTDYDSPPTLADATNTYGVRETVSLAVIVPAGTPLVKTGAGTYAYTVSGLVAGVSYQYAITRTYLGATDSTQPRTFTVQSATPHYGTRQGMLNLLGPYNEQQAADVNADGNATTISNQEEAALTDGDNAIDAKLRAAGVTATIATTDSDYRFISDAANRYSAVALSRARGLPTDAQGRTFDPYKKYLDEADAIMDQVLAVRLYAGNNTVTGPTSGNIAWSNRAFCGLSGFGWC